VLFGCRAMILADIQPAIAKIAKSPAIYDLRSITYLLSYPSIRAFGTHPGPITPDRFNQLAVMAYGWMPRIARIDSHYVPVALAALGAAQAATPATLKTVAVADVATCLRSVVGASKVLHFINDTVFPIWDSSVETFRLKGPLAYNQMHTANNYFAYAMEVHSIRQDPAFPAFLSQFNVAMNARLTALGIPHYPISEVRAIEAAAFELS
jgi:hypothetical protein